MTVIKTTPEQEKAIVDYMKSVSDIPLANKFPEFLTDNCAIRVSDAMDAAGLRTRSRTRGKGPDSADTLPVQVEADARVWMRRLGGERINVPINSDLADVLQRVKEFEPE